MASTMHPRLRRRLRSAVAGAAVAMLLTAASAAAAPATPMGAQTDAGPRSLSPGFLLDRGRYLTIEAPGATVETGAGGINNRGVIVGGARGGGRPDRGFLRDARGRYTTIRFPGAQVTVPGDINDRGQIVGLTSIDPATETARGFLLARGVDGPFTSISSPGAPAPWPSGSTTAVRSPAPTTTPTPRHHTAETAGAVSANSAAR